MTNTATKNEVPEGVKIALARFLETIRDLADRLDSGRKLDTRFGGGGRYESEILIAFVEDEANLAPLVKAREMVAEFRTMAVKNGVDGDAFIAQLGGVADIKPSDRMVAYLTEHGRFPLPVEVATYLNYLAS